MTSNHPSSVEVFDFSKEGLANRTALLGLYHTDNCFIYNQQYTTLSTNVFITSYTRTFFHFRMAVHYTLATQKIQYTLAFFVLTFWHWNFTFKF